MSMLNDGHIYSYSQLQSIDECPYGFYLQRIEKDDNGKPLSQKSNFFAEQGSLIHDIIDEWGKGKITKEQMIEEYERRYSEEVVTQPPRVLAAKGYTEKSYQQALDYFVNFDEFVGYEIISTEEEFDIDFDMGDGTIRTVRGFIDMILRDNMTGELIIVDHKSKSLSAFKKAEDEMYRQQYMYAIHVKEKYGEYPSILMFNLFKEAGMRMTRQFSMEEFERTLKWAKEQIQKIEGFDFFDWLQAKDEADFFCMEICSMREHCPNGTSKPKSKGKKGKNK